MHKQLSLMEGECGPHLGKFYQPQTQDDQWPKSQESSTFCATWNVLARELYCNFTCGLKRSSHSTSLALMFLLPPRSCVWHLQFYLASAPKWANNLSNQPLFICLWFIPNADLQDRFMSTHILLTLNRIFKDHLKSYFIILLLVASILCSFNNFFWRGNKHLEVL